MKVSLMAGTNDINDRVAVTLTLLTNENLPNG